MNIQYIVIKCAEVVGTSKQCCRKLEREIKWNGNGKEEKLCVSFFILPSWHCTARIKQNHNQGCYLEETGEREKDDQGREIKTEQEHVAKIPQKYLQNCMVQKMAAMA
jgi:hypothetical protein